MNPIQIDSPVRGMWAFMNPPGHHPDAKDFVAVDVGGKPYTLLDGVRHLLWRLHVSDVFAWEKPVFAPFEGVVVAVVNSCEDRTSLNLVKDAFTALLRAPRRKPDDTVFFLGNHIIMQSSQGFYALFAHLRQDSLTVKVGEQVRAGQTIAAIGNSGNTIQPHLHFQLMQDNAPLSAIPLPFVFSVYEKKTGNAWVREAGSLPNNRQVFRTMERE